MRFERSEEHTLFAGSVRGALAGWEAPTEPELGTWWDERDDALTARLADVGWHELWEPELVGMAVAGAIELGRAIAPVCLVDEATLGAVLAVDGRARHVEGAAGVAIVEGGLTLGRVVAAEREPALDGCGTALISARLEGKPGDADQRLGAWGAATIAYLAGLARGALDTTVTYVRAREQFGAPLSELPTMQARLADAALAADGLELAAWAAAASTDFPEGELLWAGTVAREVTASAQQGHGGVGFALESGLHRFYRRAKSVQVWTREAVRAAASAEPFG